MGKPNPSDAAHSNRVIGVVLAVMLAVSMIPVAGLQSAFADEPVERPATTGGDAALEGYATEAAPVATQREDGMLVADGLVYTVADGGLSLVGFDGLTESSDASKEIVVPEAVSVDGEDTAVVAVAIAEGNAAESVVSLTLPQSVDNVDTATLAAAFPNLASVEVAAPKASSAPVAAGAAAIKAAYSSFGGILYRNAWVASESDASQTTLTKELVWAPPATVVARIPAECRSIAPGAFADVKDLKTVVCFGVVGEIPQAKKGEGSTVTPGAFTDEQIQAVNVIVPQTGTVVPDSDGERVSASVAVTDDSTMDIKREAWWKAGFASDRITLGEVYGSTTNTLPVTEDGTLEVAEAEVAYAPETTQNSSSRKAGIEPPESAIPTPVPEDDQLNSSESGLVFTHLANMTLSVAWKGDPTTTPSHIDIPAYATINGVAYPVTEIAPNAFEGAVFLTSVTIPEGVTTIGKSAFAGCTNLADVLFPSILRMIAASAFEGTSVKSSVLVQSQGATLVTDVASTDLQQASASTVAEAEAVDDASGGTFAPISSAGSDASAPDVLSDTVGEVVIPEDSASTPLSDDSISPFYVGDMSASQLKITCYTLVSDGARSTDALPQAQVGWSPVKWEPNGNPASSGTATPTNGSTITRITVVFDDEGRLRIEYTTTSGFLGEGRMVLLAPYKIDSCHLMNGYLDLFVSTKTVDASRITGVLSSDRIPNLDASKIASGTFGASRIAAGAIGNAGLANDAVTSDKIENGEVKTDDLGTGAVTDDKLAVKFGSITYSGLDGADMSVYPTTYRQGGTPALPVPKKVGSEFLGWTWNGQENPTTDANILKGAFSGSGDVTLTANWGAPAASYFFQGTPMSAQSGGTNVIKVSVPGQNVKSAKLVKVDGSSLIGSGKESSIKFGVGASSQTAAGSHTWDGSGAWTGGGVTLTESDGHGGYWLYVAIDMPAEAVDAGSVYKSYAPGDYVASFVTLEYELA